MDMSIESNKTNDELTIQQNRKRKSSL